MSDCSTHSKCGCDSPMACLNKDITHQCPVDIMHNMLGNMGFGEHKLAFLEVV